MIAMAQARSLWRRRWHAAAVAWLFCLVGWIFVVQLPDQYQAKARVYVDTESMLRPLMRGIAVDSDILSEVDLIQRTLLSRPNLEKISHMADLDLAAHSQGEVDAVIDRLRHNITVTGEGRNLFTLSYTGASRDIAVKVVQSLLTVFVESNLGNSRKDMLSARNFIDDQLRDYAQQLDESERRIADFKGKNMGSLPGDNSYSSRLDLSRQELQKTQAELDENVQRRMELAKQLSSVPRYIDSYSDGPGPMGGDLGLPGDPSAGPGDADSDPQISALQSKMQDLLIEYTENYPDVVKIKKQIERLKKQKEEKDKEAKAAPPPPADAPVVGPNAVKNTTSNPVYEQIQLQLVTLDTNIASLQARVRREQADVDQWQHLAQSVPQVGAELAKMTRDYDVIKTAYDELLNRRESAKIGSDLATQTQSVQFRIIDPPDAPTVPVAPNRPVLLSVVLAAGIAAGGALAFLLSKVDDSIMTMRELRETLSVPVLGTISRVRTATRTRRFDWATSGFVVACLALFVVYVGVVSFETLVRPHI